MIYAVITGASRGIGSALANECANAGYGLILTCEKNIELLEMLKSSIETKNPKLKESIHCIKGNLNENILNALLKKDDQIFLLINNASKANYKLLQDLTIEEWNDLLKSNLTTVFENTKAVLHNMIHNKQGIILNISSMWGLVGASNEVAYSATKGGVNIFTKALAKELEPNNIETFALALGMVDTDMNKHLTKEERKAVENTLTNKKMFSKEEIANKIFDIIKYHKFKNGEIIEINNGLK